VAGPDPVTTLAFSPDGRLLAWGGKDNTAHVRDLAGGRELWNDRGGRAFVSALAFSPDARLLVVGRSGASVQDVDTMLWHVPPTPAAADSD
jgi:WD40 repeat protein